MVNEKNNFFYIINSMTLLLTDLNIEHRQTVQSTPTHTHQVKGTLCQFYKIVSYATTHRYTANKI